MMILRTRPGYWRQDASDLLRHLRALYGRETTKRKVGNDIFVTTPYAHEKADTYLFGPRVFTVADIA